MAYTEAGRIIGHRGAPADLPENTIESFRRAFRVGADAVETDIQVSADGVLVLVHDTELSRITNVASMPEYAGRRTRRAVGAKTLDGWFVDDFTLAELRTLTPANQPIPTLDELLLFFRAESGATERKLGLNLEVKKPRYFAERGLAITDRLLHTLADHGFTDPEDGIWIQSFDSQFVRQISTKTNMQLLQLVDLKQRFTCTDVATYADAIGPHRALVFDAAGDTGLITAAHRAGLTLNVWTMMGGEREARQMLRAGADGLFVDDPAAAVAARSLALSY